METPRPSKNGLKRDPAWAQQQELSTGATESLHPPKRVKKEPCAVAKKTFRKPGMRSKQTLHGQKKPCASRNWLTAVKREPCAGTKRTFRKPRTGGKEALHRRKLTLRGRKKFASPERAEKKPATGGKETLYIPKMVKKEPCAGIKKYINLSQAQNRRKRSPPRAEKKPGTYRKVLKKNPAQVQKEPFASPERAENEPSTGGKVTRYAEMG